MPEERSKMRSWKRAIVYQQEKTARHASGIQIEMTMDPDSLNCLDGVTQPWARTLDVAVVDSRVMAKEEAFLGEKRF